MHNDFIEAAITEAKLSLNEGGIPVGAVLVYRDKIMGRGHNRRVQANNPILHAEIDCLQNAGRIINYRQMVMYTTLMPCFMCAGALVQFGIRNLVVGESRNFQGAKAFLQGQGVSVADLNDPTCIQLVQDFIVREPSIWNEDIGKV